MFSLSEILSLEEIKSFMVDIPSTSSAMTLTTNKTVTTVSSSPLSTATHVTNMHPPIMLPGNARYC